MRIDVTQPEFEAIVNRLKGINLKSERKIVEQLAQRLDWQLHPSKMPDSNGWAPMKRVSIRSSMPSGIFKPDRKAHWSFNKPTKTPTKKAPLSADQILAEL